MTERLTGADKRLFEDLLKRDDVLVLIHRNPDGDAIGTGLALQTVFAEAGKRAAVACSGEVPERLRFLTDGKARLTCPFTPKTVVAVDTATAEMLGKDLEEYESRVEFCLDHHATNTHYASRSVVKGGASSAGEVLYRLLRAVGRPVSQKTAGYLYAAVASDTGSFKYANTSPLTLRIAADLMRLGVPCAAISRSLFDVSDAAHLRLEGRCCDAIRTYYGGKLSVVSVPLKLLDECGVDENDCDGLVSVPRRVDGIVMAALLRERSDGTVRLSLRSEDDRVDVSAVAARFGGGGHKRASGCTMDVSLEEAERTLVESVRGDLEKPL